MRKLTQSKLDRIVEAAVAKRNIHGAVFHVNSLDDSISFTSAFGNIQPDGRYYIASINKLFVSAITLHLSRDKKLNISDKIGNYLSEDIMKGLLIFNETDYSNEITIAHLISHRSGLPCYLDDKRPGRPKVMEELLKGVDQEFPVEKVVAQVKTMKSKFRPGQKGKASYSDTNFRLMVKILEVITGEQINSMLDSIFHELGMEKTYVISSEKHEEHLPVYVKEKPVWVPHYFASTGHDIISTAQDIMIFLKAFFGGYFYPKEKLQELEKWTSIFFPFKYGIGIQKLYVPRILSPFQAVPDMIGHCGSVGTVAFYVPEKKVFITGTVNQTSSTNLPFQVMIKILNQM